MLVLQPKGHSRRGSRNQSFLKQVYARGAHLNLPEIPAVLVVQAEIH